MKALFKPLTALLAFVVLSGFYTIIDHIPAWSMSSLVKGLVCGLPILTIWWTNKHIGLVLSLLGLMALILTAGGAFNDVERDRLFFTGMSLGLVLGIVPAFYIRPLQFWQFVRHFAQSDGYIGLKEKASRRLNELNEGSNADNE